MDILSRCHGRVPVGHVPPARHPTKQTQKQDNKLPSAGRPLVKFDGDFVRDAYEVIMAPPVNADVAGSDAATADDDASAALCASADAAVEIATGSTTSSGGFSASFSTGDLSLHFRRKIAELELVASHADLMHKSTTEQ